MSVDTSESDEGPPTSGPEPTKRASACSVCNEAPARYRCPGCNVRSCSLACSKAHKQESGCTGKRARTAYVPLQAFTDRELISDFRLLEETVRVQDNAARNRAPVANREMPIWLASMVQQARWRKVQLQLLPPGMQKRINNTSKYDRRGRKFLWRVDWQFVAAGVTIADQRVDEATVLSELLAPHLTLRPGQAVRHHQLRDYVAAGISELVVVMRKERCLANNQLYYRINLAAPLAAQLAFKTIIEYPVLQVTIAPVRLPE
ncbi:hypothetical protein WJX72_001076 [[Myrmecia] bisecta]|uniref:Box C/D snoRNA protein 1 n=1 Tax=[Myrmecia] bisecta TaxID=41462 RepID=A0AAW1PMX7_9CHLO